MANVLVVERDDSVRDDSVRKVRLDLLAEEGGHAVEAVAVRGGGPCAPSPG